MRLGLIAAGAAVLLGIAAMPASAQSTFADELARVTILQVDRASIESERIDDLLRQMVGLHQAPPAKPGEGKPVSVSLGNDSCQWANDLECDHPGIGTGVCLPGTDYSDCWRIEQNIEDDSCQYARDGECDEVRLGGGYCAQGTDRTDCGAIAPLRFQNDSCGNALNGVCNEPGVGDGSCEVRTDRGDCVGRERPDTINDHYFGFDDRVVMDTAAFPWSVIGSLVDENGGGCTATLIAETVIITAAHCIEYETGVDARSTFLTGFGMPGGPRSANVIAWLQSPDRPGDLDVTDNEGTDWAMLRIDQPLGAELGFVGVRPITTYGSAALQQALYQAGYSWDTGDNLSGNVGCDLLTIEDDNTISHNCDTTHGDSGSPLMVRDGEDYFVIATDSAFRFVGEGPVSNYSTRVEGWLDYLPAFIAGEIGNPIGGAGPGKPAVK